MLWQIVGWLGTFMFIASIFVPELQEFFLGGGTGTILAVTVTGPVTHATTDTALPEHIERDVSTIITFKRPHDYPLDTLLRQVGRKLPATNFKVEWEEVDVRPVEDATTAGYTIVAGGNPGQTAVLSVANAAMWAVDDVGRVDGVDGNVAGIEFNFLVTAVNESGNQITITGLNGFDDANTAGVNGDRIPSIGSATKLYRIGSAKDELDAQTTEKYQIPSQLFNYCQTFMAQLSQGQIEAKMKAYSRYNYSDKKNLGIWDFRSQCENSHLWGVKVKQAVGSKIHYTAGGIINSISNTINFGSGGGSVDPSVADVIDMTEAIFAPNRGSQKRYAFCGKEVVSGLDKMPIGDRRVEATQEEVVAGFKVKKLISSHGEVYIIPHKGLDRAGWAKKAVIVDFENLVKRELIPTTATPLELNKSGQKRVINAYRLDETSCVETRYAGTDGVHAVWEPAA